MLALAIAINHVFATEAMAAPRKSEALLEVTQEHTSDADVNWKATAKALDLGTRRMASHLLTRAPSRAVRAAAKGRGAKRLLWPVDGGHFVRGFGLVRKERTELPHLGVDIAAREGTAIFAAADGIVGYADQGVKGYGNLAILVHADGTVTSYAHCSALHVQPGQTVKRGDVIANVGSTGISRGPHLHFEFRLRGRPRNPMTRFDRPEKKAPALALLTVPEVLTEPEAPAGQGESILALAGRQE